MLDHINVNVGDFERSKAFYKTALAPLHYQLRKEIEGACGFGVRPALYSQKFRRRRAG